MAGRRPNGALSPLSGPQWPQNDLNGALSRLSGPEWSQNDGNDALSRVSPPEWSLLDQKRRLSLLSRPELPLRSPPARPVGSIGRFAPRPHRASSSPRSLPAQPGDSMEALPPARRYR